MRLIRPRAAISHRPFGSGLYHPGIKELGKEFMTALIENAIEAATKAKAFLYCGEYGVIYAAPCEGIVSWYQDIHEVFEANGIARAAWTYKAMDFGISDWYEEHIREAVIRNL